MIHHKPQNIFRLLFIRKDSLLADIEDQIQIVAETRTDEHGRPLGSLNNASTRFAVQFNRWIDKYLDLAKSRMAAYLVESMRKASTNITRQWDEVELHLSFPPTWNETTFEQLGEAVHGYIVNSVLKEFFILTLTSKDPLTQDKFTLAEDCYAQIKHCCVTSKPGTQRKTLHPF